MRPIHVVQALLPFVPMQKNTYQIPVPSRLSISLATHYQSFLKTKRPTS